MPQPSTKIPTDLHERTKGSPTPLLLIGEFTSGGAETLVTALANRLSFEGWRVHLSARKDGPVSLLLRDPTALTIVPKRGTVDPGHIRGLVTLIRRQRIDLVHAHLFGANFYGFLAARAAGARIIQTIHGMSCFDSPRRLATYRLMAPFVDRIVTVSDTLTSEMLRRTRISPHKLCTIPNGIDIHPSPSDEDNRRIRQELTLEDRFPIIGTIGNIKRVKGHDILIRAAPAIQRAFPKAIILIVGDTSQDPSYKSELDELISRSHLTNVVTFLGYRPDAPRLLSLFDVFVLPSRSEGLSLALLEAMASQRPIVATHVGGTAGVLAQGHTALLVPPEDPDALTESILRLLTDASLSTTLGAHAAFTARHLYSTDMMVERYKQLYLQVCSR